MLALSVSLLIAVPVLVHGGTNPSVVSLPEKGDCEIFYMSDAGTRERITNNEFDDLYPSTVLGLNGERHIVWIGFEDEDENGEIFYAYRNSGAWSRPTKLTDNSVSDTSPTVVIDLNGTVWIAWCHFDGEDDEIYCMRSVGNDWSNPERVNTDDATPDICPVFETDSDGKLCLTWSGYDGDRYRTYSSLWDGEKWSEEEKAEEEKRVPRASHRAAIIENKYVGFGDSITWGSGGTQGGYGGFLEEKLRAIYPGAVVVLRGGGGERTSDGVERIDSVLEEENGEYMLILEGTNDVQAFISGETIAFNLGEMVRKTTEYGSIPVLGTLPPRRDLDNWNDWTEGVNRDHILPLARQEGVLVADHWKFFYAEPDWEALIGRKSEHPNDAGYAVMADCWFVAIEEDSPPTGLTATAEEQRVLLRWDANNDESGFAGYNIYKKSPSWNDYESLNDELITETVYEDTGLSSNYYVYTVTAVDKCGNESDYSAEVAVDLSSEDGIGCFIATACYGSPLAREVRVLSKFRDEYLLRNSLGRAFVRGYYGAGPAVSEFIREKPLVKFLLRAQLKPFVKIAGVIANRKIPRLIRDSSLRSEQAPQSAI